MDFGWLEFGLIEVAIVCGLKLGEILAKMIQAKALNFYYQFADVDLVTYQRAALVRYLEDFVLLRYCGSPLASAILERCRRVAAGTPFGPDVEHLSSLPPQKQLKQARQLKDKIYWDCFPF